MLIKEKKYTKILITKDNKDENNNIEKIPYYDLINKAGFSTCTFPF